MSIVTLKRKSNSTSGCSISGRPGVGFSLQGTFRGQGRVGQQSSSLSGRTLVRTTMKGGSIDARGFGSCCGLYDQTAEVPTANEITTTEDRTAAKNAVLNTRGMLAERQVFGAGITKSWNRLTDGDGLRQCLRQSLKTNCVVVDKRPPMGTPQVPVMNVRY